MKLRQEGISFFVCMADDREQTDLSRMALGNAEEDRHGESTDTSYSSSQDMSDDASFFLSADGNERQSFTTRKDLERLIQSLNAEFDPLASCRESSIDVDWSSCADSIALARKRCPNDVDEDDSSTSSLSDSQDDEESQEYIAELGRPIRWSECYVVRHDPGDKSAQK